MVAHHYNFAAAALLLFTVVHSTSGVRAYAKEPATVKVVGDRYYHPASPKDYLQAYVRLPVNHYSRTTPVAVGVELTSGFVQKASDLPVTIELDIPVGPNETFHISGSDVPATFVPAVGTNPFTFVYWGFGHKGHPPVGVYDVPHFDFHFMFKSFDYWWNKTWTPDKMGPCMGSNGELFFNSFKPIPESCWPGKPTGPITQVGDFVFSMGSHLYDMSGPEFNPKRQFNYTQIYGMYNGEIAYMEPMISQALMMTKGFKECRQLVNNPKAMKEETFLPSQLCLETTTTSFKVEYRGFKKVPAGCHGPYVGAYPATAPQLPADLCPVPAVPPPVPRPPKLG